MATLDFESDRFLHLLTEALRAGPGSPAWRDAVVQLREQGAHGDEYRLLCAARECLESGREYRSVRAGPEFTRRVMLALEQPQGSRWRQRLPTASVIAILSMLTLLVVVAVVALVLFSGDNPTHSPVDALAGTYFVQPVMSTRFDAPLGPAWRSFGTLPLDTTRGLRPLLLDQASEDLPGGGVIWTQPLPAGEPIAIEAVLRVNHPSPQLMAQVIVTDQADFADGRATAPRELVWSFNDGTASAVLPGGNVEAQHALGEALPGTLAVRLLLDADHAIVESNGKRLWAGRHQLPRRPRYIGLRFLLRTDQQPHAADEPTPRPADRPDALVFQSLRLLGSDRQ